MLNFNNTMIFKTDPSTLFANLSNTLASTNVSLKSMLNRLSTDFLSKTQKYATFCHCFDQYPSLIPDELLDGAIVTSDDRYNITDSEQISMVKDLTQSVHEWAKLYGEKVVSQDDRYRFTLTTANGNVIPMQTSTNTVGYFLYYYDKASDTYKVWCEWFYNGTYTCFTQFFVKDINGRLISTIDLIAEMKVNSELNSLYHQASISADSVDNYINGLQEYANSEFQVVADQCHSFQAAFSTNGLYGIISLFKQLFTDMNNVGEVDGLIAFTDNSTFMPSEYITGMLPSLVTTVGLAISAIAAIATPILGAISAGFVWGISKISETYFDYDTNTLAGLSSDATICATPFHAWQYEYEQNFVPTTSSAYGHENDSITKFYNSVHVSTLPMIVDGGVVQRIISCSSNVTRVEDHIDLRDRTSWTLSWLSNHSSEEQMGTAAPYYYEYITEFNFDEQYYDGMIWGHIEDFNPQISDSGLLSVTDDRKLRLIIACNLFWNLLSKYPYSGSHCTEWRMGSYRVNGYEKDYYQIYVGDVYLSHHSGDWLGLVTGYSYFKNSQSWDTAWYVARLHHALCLIAFHNDYTEFENVCNWSGLISICDNISYKCELSDGTNEYSMYPWTAEQVYTFYGYVRSAYTFESKQTYPIKVPKYNRNTYWGNVIAFTVAAATLAIVGITMAVKVKIWASKDALRRNAQIEQLYENYYSNPTPENQKAYRRAVLKNNIMSTIFGGEKYSKTGRWVEPSESGGVSNVIRSVLANTSGATSAQSFSDISTNINTGVNNVVRELSEKTTTLRSDIHDISVLIKGN